MQVHYVKWVKLQRNIIRSQTAKKWIKVKNDYKWFKCYYNIISGINFEKLIIPVAEKILLNIMFI